MTKYLGIKDSDINFNEFVKYICSQPISKMDPHWKIQYDLNKNSYIEYDFIGKFENLEMDLKIILQRVGINFKDYYKIEARHATSANNKLNEYYNEKLREMIYVKYKIDFDSFGYER